MLIEFAKGNGWFLILALCPTLSPLKWWCVYAWCSFSRFLFLVVFFSHVFCFSLFSAITPRYFPGGPRNGDLRHRLPGGRREGHREGGSCRPYTVHAALPKVGARAAAAPAPAAASATVVAKRETNIHMPPSLLSAVIYHTPLYDSSEAIHQASLT